VAKSRNNFSSLSKRLSLAKTENESVRRGLLPTDLVNQSQAGSTQKSSKIGNQDARPSSITGKVTLEGITFGRPSQSSSKSGSSSGSEWTSLLKHTASGGIASALSGGFGGIGGIGSLVSGIFSLFGGGGGGTKTPPPLVEFQLPNPQQQTLYLSSTGSSLYQGGVEQSSVPAGGATYGNSGQIQTSGAAPGAEWIQEQSAQIAQAVKTALLHSSSLNDVIAEI
jgi:hypothetical protein